MNEEAFSWVWSGGHGSYRRWRNRTGNCWGRRVPNHRVIFVTMTMKFPLHWAAVYGSTNGFFRARLLICYTANTVAQHISRVHYCTYETLTKCTLQDLAYRFVVSLSTVSRIFSYWIVAMQLSKCSQEDRSFVVNVSSSPQQQSCLRFLFLELTQRNQKSSGFTPPNFWRP